MNTKLALVPLFPALYVCEMTVWNDFQGFIKNNLPNCSVVHDVQPVFVLVISQNVLRVGIAIFVCFPTSLVSWIDRKYFFKKNM